MLFKFDFIKEEKNLQNSFCRELFNKMDYLEYYRKLEEDVKEQTQLRGGVKTYRFKAKKKTRRSTLSQRGDALIAMVGILT